MKSRTVAASLLGIFLFSAPGHAQQEVDGSGEPETVVEREPLLAIQDAYLAAGFTLATLALYPLDRALAEEFQDSTLQAVDFARSAARALSAGGSSPVWFAGSAALYGVGRISGSRPLAETGIHAAEAIVVSSVITSAIKSIAGRARPQLGVDSPRDFNLGRGFGNKDYQSFPSGHTTGSFAAASAITSEVNRHWPDRTWYVGPALYGTATLVGISRMYNNKHWASDIAVGAAIGIFSGLKVVSYNHSRPDNRLERWLLPSSIAPDARGGISLGWHFATATFAHSASVEPIRWAPESSDIVSETHADATSLNERFIVRYTEITTGTWALHSNQCCHVGKLH